MLVRSANVHCVKSRKNGRSNSAGLQILLHCVPDNRTPGVDHFMTNSKGWIFAAGVLALALSLYLWFSGSDQAAIFVGLWVPSLWILADLVDQAEAVAQ
jgi:hypothetical protein